MKKVKILNNLFSQEENNKILFELCNTSWFIAFESTPRQEQLFVFKKHLGFSLISNERNNNEDIILNNFANKVTEKVLSKLNIKGKISRFMWNHYLSNQNSSVHTDHNQDNFISILYNLHTTDGGTEIDKKFYPDKVSQAKVFKSNLLHRGIGPKKDVVRFNLNIVIET